MSFNTGELVKRSTISKSPKGYCVIVDKTKDNYTLYNNSLKCLQYVAVGVVEALYERVTPETTTDNKSFSKHNPTGEVYEYTWNNTIE